MSLYKIEQNKTNSFHSSFFNVLHEWVAQVSSARSFHLRSCLILAVPLLENSTEELKFHKLVHSFLPFAFLVNIGCMVTVWDKINSATADRASFFCVVVLIRGDVAEPLHCAFEMNLIPVTTSSRFRTTFEDDVGFTSKLLQTNWTICLVLRFTFVVNGWFYNRSLKKDGGLLWRRGMPPACSPVCWVHGKKTVLMKRGKYKS